ncbi:unnamed protein product, partial [Discosporangium mesarthrocarpum]
MAEVIASPFCRVVLAKVTMIDPGARGTIRNSISWELLGPPPEADLAAAVEANGRSMAWMVRKTAPLELSGKSQRAMVGATGGRGGMELAGYVPDIQSRLSEVVNRCKLHGVQFVDTSFPPTDASLGPSLAGRVAWKRPGDFPGAAFGGAGRPSPEDVRAAAVAADASLGCALLALVERPHLVRAALCLEGRPGARARGAGIGTGIGTGAGLGAGAFAARVCVGGTWEEMVLDDLFPCWPGHEEKGAAFLGAGGGGGPCLSRAHGPGLWVCMLEKAYARASGSYTTALGGLVAEAGALGKAPDGALGGGAEKGTLARPAEILSAFTGAPFLDVQLTGEEAAHEAASGNLWGTLVSWIKEGWLVCLSTPPAQEPPYESHNPPPSLPTTNNNGRRLPGGQGYFVASTTEFGGAKLLRLRGPLPPEGWQGEWGEGSSRWTPEESAAGVVSSPCSCPGYSQSKGVKQQHGFWVSMEETLSLFTTAGVCMANGPGGRGWAEARRRVSFVWGRGGGGKGEG